MLRSWCDPPGPWVGTAAPGDVMYEVWRWADRPGTWDSEEEDEDEEPDDEEEEEEEEEEGWPGK